LSRSEVEQLVSCPDRRLGCGFAVTAVDWISSARTRFSRGDRLIGPSLLLSSMRRAIYFLRPAPSRRRTSKSQQGGTADMSA